MVEFTFGVKKIAEQAVAENGLDNEDLMSSLRTNQAIDKSLALTSMQDNVMLNAFRIAINGGLTLQNMVDAFIDEYEDETGVDVGASINETYDSVNDLYNNSVLAVDAVPVMTSNTSPSGIATASSFFGTGSDPFKVFDNDPNTTWLPTNGVNTGWVAYQFASTKTIVKYEMVFDNVGNSTNQSPRDWTFEGSVNTGTGGPWVVLDTVVGEPIWNNSGERRSYTFSNTTPYINYRLNVTAVNGSLLNLRIAELDMFETDTGQNMTIVSNAQTAQSQPVEARLTLFDEDISSIVLNTDLKAFISRDGGTTWGQVTLTDQASLSNGLGVCAGSVDVSVQPAGTSMKYKIETFNSKEIKLHGASIQWK